MTSDDEDCKTLHLLDEVENYEIVQTEEKIEETESKVEVVETSEKPNKPKKTTKKQPVKNSSKK